MTEGVRENDVAAVVDQIAGSLVALIGLRNTGLLDLFYAGRFTGSLRGFHEVLVIGGVFIM